jgi:hypothetical protein
MTEETPMAKEAPVAEATPGVGRSSRRGYPQSRYARDTKDLSSNATQCIGEDDGDDRQASYQKCSNTRANDC